MTSHSHAAWLPSTHQPPHDPRRLPLNSRNSWRLAASNGVEEDACGRLALAPRPGAERSLAEGSGAMGGLRLPKYLVYQPAFGILLLDRANMQLKKFDVCNCRFVTVPCTGGEGQAPREFSKPGAIALCGDNLLVADTGNRRLVVYSLLGFLVRGIWLPPVSATVQPWKPVDVVVSHDRRVLVADAANGCVHVFNFAGRWLWALSGLGAMTTLAVDCANHLYVVTDEASPASVLDLSNGKKLQDVSKVDALYKAFPEPAFATNAEGHFDLGWLCRLYTDGTTEGADAVWFNQQGNRLAQAPVAQTKYQLAGTAWSQALDSRLYRCQWDRVALELKVPRGTRVQISTFSAESPLTTAQLQALEDDQWLTRQWVFPHETDAAANTDWDCLIRSAPGRYLWLKIDMRSDATTTPTISNMVLDFPRISLARYLPKVFSAEPHSADFTDRFLAVFDRGFRDIEKRIDTMGALLDPLSAPAAAGRKDFLSWLASWVGVTLDRQLPLDLRRRLVKNAGHLYQCRGTLTGLRNMLDLYLGFSSRRCEPVKTCGPCTTKPPFQWQPPQLVLEHFRLRRWLFVGYGRLGEQALLWGQKIVNRSQLSGPEVDGNAQLGVSELNTRQDPLRDPFHVYAHKFSVFLPGWVGRIAKYQRSMERMLGAEKPAHTQVHIVYVEPRFRIGIQSMIGFDSVIGCYPQGVTLDATRLGKASVLSESERRDSTVRVGEKATIGQSFIVK